MIFLVLIGVWAAYFVHYWVRRRAHLATARTVDAFSASMRILERRTQAVHADAAPRSYAAHPTRAVTGRRATEHVLVSTAAAPAPRRAPGARPRAVRPSRRARGLTLLVAAAAAVATGAGAVVGLLPWVASAAPAGAVVLAVLWLRAADRAERAARGVATADRARRAPTPTVVVVPAPTATLLDDERPAPASVATEDLLEVVADLAPEPVTVLEPEPVPVMLVDEDDIPLTWDPIPVPRPTYTMKAKVERPAPPPAETTPVPAAAEHDDVAYDEPTRRVAGA